MANLARVDEFNAELIRRDQRFRPLTEASFESNGVCFWRASELREFLGYKTVASFESCLNRARVSAGTSGHQVDAHFVPTRDAENIEDVALSKYAAYLTVMNADPSKPRVALAQEFFAIQTERQVQADEKRLETRFKAKEAFRTLSGAAKNAGVLDSHQPIFLDAGVRGLYDGLSTSQVKQRKGVAKDDNLLDHVDNTEMSMNLLRMNLTRDKLDRENIKSEGKAIEAHRNVGAAVRKAVLETGSKKPEDLPRAAKSLDEISKERLKQVKSFNKRSEQAFSDDPSTP